VVQWPQMMRLKSKATSQGFKVRVTSAWMTDVADLEAEMIKRGMIFDLIAWDKTVDGLL